MHNPQGTQSSRRLRAAVMALKTETAWCISPPLISFGEGFCTAGGFAFSNLKHIIWSEVGIHETSLHACFLPLQQAVLLKQGTAAFCPHHSPSHLYEHWPSSLRLFCTRVIKSSSLKTSLSFCNLRLLF